MGFSARCAKFCNSHDRFPEQRKPPFFEGPSFLLMTKPVTRLLAGTWALLAGLSSGCEPYSPHGSTEVGMLFDYIVRHDSLRHGPFVVVPARFFQSAAETDSATLVGRTARLRYYLPSKHPALRAECLAMPNASAEWQALRAQLPASGTEDNVIFLAFSARCDGPDGRHYYYVERHGVEAGRLHREYEGDVYQVCQGRVEREILVWIS